MMNLYSCSTDKAFYVTDLNNGNNVNTLVNVSQSGYTNLEYDQKYQRIFLTNESGELQVYNVIVFPPALVKKLQTSCMSCIRAFHLDLMNNYIFTGSVNGKICIMNVGVPGKEHLISEISTFGVSIKIRLCRYNSKNHELITADEDGRVTIWSLKEGKPVYMWEAHPQSAITQMWFDQEKNLLWTGGKDLSIRVWRLPEKWVSSQIIDFEKNKKSEISAKIAAEKIEKVLSKNDQQEDSDDDDLNGWDHYPY